MCLLDIIYRQRDRYVLFISTIQWCMINIHHSNKHKYIHTLNLIVLTFKNKIDRNSKINGGWIKQFMRIIQKINTTTS